MFDLSSLPEAGRRKAADAGRDDPPAAPTDAPAAAAARVSARSDSSTSSSSRNRCTLIAPLSRRQEGQVGFGERFCLWVDEKVHHAPIRGHCSRLVGCGGGGGGGDGGSKKQRCQSPGVYCAHSATNVECAAIGSARATKTLLDGPVSHPRTKKRDTASLEVTGELIQHCKLAAKKWWKYIQNWWRQSNFSLQRQQTQADHACKSAED